MNLTSAFESTPLNISNVSELAEHDRPREKLESLGPEGLSDYELLMILIGSGGRGRSVTRIAADLLARIQSCSGPVSLEVVSEVLGIGKAKGSLIVAALEFARRRFAAGGIKIRQPQDILPYVHQLKSHAQENFVTISLNGNHEVIQVRVVTIGLANFCQVHPREVFADVITDRATALIVAHNHPSGNLEPSQEDLSLTKRLVQASRILGIKLLDHVIFTNAGCVSLRDSYLDHFEQG